MRKPADKCRGKEVDGNGMPEIKAVVNVFKEGFPHPAIIFEVGFGLPSVISIEINGLTNSDVDES